MRSLLAWLNDALDARAARTRRRDRMRAGFSYEEIKALEASDRGDDSLIEALR